MGKLVIPSIVANGGSGGGGGSSLVPSITWYTGNTGTTITVLDTTSYNYVEVYKNGVLLEDTEDYTINGTTLTLETALVAEDKIAIKINSLSSLNVNNIESELSGI